MPKAESDSTDASPRSVAPVSSSPQLAESAGPGPGKGEAHDQANEIPCADLPFAQRVEALLFASDRPLSDRRVLELLGLSDGSPKEVTAAVDALNRIYAETGRCFRIESVAGGHRVLTATAFGPVIERLRGERDQSRLSQAALETLAIVAYRQPVLRAELEAIRGVACGEVLRTLIERRLVRVSGRAEIVGRPLLYGTTREFLKVLGLASVDDLPKISGGSPPPRSPGTAP